MISKERALQYILIGLCIWYAFFYQLGATTYRLWDESRLITSAYEMSKSGNLLVPTFDNKPDMWNTKPPLMIWTQAANIKLLGLSEFSARLPAAVCAAITALLLFAFILR